MYINRNSARLMMLLLWLAPIIAFSPRPQSIAGGMQYAVRDIPPGLRNEADAVIRKQEVIFEVRDVRRSSLKVTSVVTVFTKEGRHHGEIDLPYNRSWKLSTLEGRLFDEQGEEIRTLESQDMHDLSAPGSDLYSDMRLRTGELYSGRLPYTVEFTYEFDCDGILTWPGWVAQSGEEPVEYSRFEVIVPDTGHLRYWVNRDSCQPAIQTKESKRVYIWEVRNLPELPREALDETLNAGQSLSKQRRLHLNWMSLPET